MILTTYKYVDNWCKMIFFFVKKNISFITINFFYIVYFSFNYFSLTKIFYGMRFGMSNRIHPINILKITV